MALPQKTVFSLSTHDRYNAAVYFIDRNLELGLADKVAIRSDDGDVTYGDLYQLMNRVGNGLKALQVYMENRVALLLHDSVEFIASFFGTVKIGGIPIPVNTLLSPQDHVYILNDSRAKVAIIEAGLWQRLRDMGAALPFLKHVVVVCRTGETAPPESLDFSAWAAEQPPELAPADTVYDDAAFWLYTSGSTGKPKGVIHLQHDMEVALHNYAENILRMGADDVTFSASKLFFAYGMGNGMYFPLGVGGTTVLLRQPPTPQAVMETVQKYRPTLFFGVPTLYAAMLDYVEKTKRSFDFSSVRQGSLPENRCRRPSSTAFERYSAWRFSMASAPQRRSTSTSAIGRGGSAGEHRPAGAWLRSADCGRGRSTGATRRTGRTDALRRFARRRVLEPACPNLYQISWGLVADRG
ncbi:hypothetical protein GCM10025857_27240 [Alicyclobacillus contaminans]|nr:hypothetical protein GCM10025857_27240 [Alicyclobacillus contaminans]